MSRSAGSSMAWGTTLSLARLISGVIRIKVVALALGVSGVGIFSLLQQINLTGAAIVSMSLSAPIINLGRPRAIDGRVAEAGEIAGTALTLVTLNAAVLCLAAGLFGRQVVHQIADGALRPELAWPVVLSIVFTAYTTAFWEAMSFLADRFDVYVRVGIAGAVTDMVCVATGAFLFGLPGAIAAMPVGIIVQFCSYAVMLKREKLARRVLAHLSIKMSQVPRLLAFSAIMIGAVAVTNLGLTLMRSRVLLSAGATANGYLQTATSLAAYILAFVTPGFWGHIYSRAAAAGDTSEVRKELHHALQLGLLISFTGCGLALVLADDLLPIFYTRQFSKSAGLIVGYMPGEFCFEFLTLLISYQITISRRRRYLAWSIGYIGLLVPIAIVAIPRVGAAGYVVAHVIASILMTSVAGYRCWRSGQIRTSLVLFVLLFFCILVLESTIILDLHDQLGHWIYIGLAPYFVSGSIAIRHLLSDLSQFKAWPVIGRRSIHEN